MKKFTYQNQGFSLIETLIAVSILMIAIAGPLALVQAGLFSSIHQRNQVTATYLAQEALEFVKNMRDSNAYSYYKNLQDGTAIDFWLKGRDGTSLLEDCGKRSPAANSGCYVDPHKTLDGKYVQPANNQGKKFYLSNGYTYDYNTNGKLTSYERVVTIEEVNPEEVTVTVKMSWKDNSLPRSYTVSTNLFNYQIGELAPEPPVVGGDDGGGIDPGQVATEECRAPDVGGGGDNVPVGGSIMFSDFDPVIPGKTYYMRYKEGALKYNSNLQWQLNSSPNGFKIYYDNTSIAAPGNSVGYSSVDAVRAANANSYANAVKAFTPQTDNYIRIGFQDSNYGDNIAGNPTPTFCLSDTPPTVAETGDDESNLGTLLSCAVINDITYEGRVPLAFDPSTNNYTFPKGNYTVAYKEGAVQFSPSTGWRIRLNEPNGNASYGTSVWYYGDEDERDSNGLLVGPIGTNASYNSPDAVKTGQKDQLLRITQGMDGHGIALAFYYGPYWPLTGGADAGSVNPTYCIYRN